MATPLNASRAAIVPLLLPSGSALCIAYTDGRAGAWEHGEGDGV